MEEDCEAGSDFKEEEVTGEMQSEGSERAQRSDSDRRQHILAKLDDAEPLLQALFARAKRKMASNEQSSNTLSTIQQHQQQQHRTYKEMIEGMSITEFKADPTHKLEALIARWQNDLVMQLSSLLSDQDLMDLKPLMVSTRSGLS